MSAFDDLIQNPTLAGVRSLVYGYAAAANLIITNWLKGGVGQQTFEAQTRAAYNYVSVQGALVRGFASLDTSTDPGDVDPYNPSNATLPPSPGLLSAFGENTFGTKRIGQTFASGFVTFTNGGAGSRTFGPETLVFTWTANTPPTPAPTYTNVADPTVYTNPDGTVTVAAGASVDLPIQAQEIGTRSNVGVASSITMTTVLLGCSATNAAAVLGQDREGANAFRARCRLAPSSVSPNGPADAIRYIALGSAETLNGDVYYLPTATDVGLGIDSDGNIVQLPNPVGTSLGITRAQVTNDSATGNVIGFFATAAGAPSGGTVTKIANLLNAIYWPDATTRSFNAAIGTTVTTTATIKAKGGPGITTAVIANAISAALAAAFPEFPVGGFDQTAGAGTLYADEVKAIINNAHPAIYHVAMTSPAGDTALALGHVAVLSNTITSGDVTLT